MEEIKQWFDSIDVRLIPTIKSVLNGTCGKKGAILLQGPPSTGKSIIVKIFCAKWDRRNIGVITRSCDNNTFWMQDLIHKDVYVGEELCLSDVGADAFKLVLEGHFLASTDVKNKDKVGLPRRPIILTSNFNICYLCPRQTESVLARCNHFMFNIVIEETHPINIVHSMTNEQLYKLHCDLFE